LLLGCERHLVTLVPHQAAWAEVFRQEAESLARALGNRVVRTEHIGSTSVPGLDAKPILDIVVAVNCLADERWFEEALAPLGYRHKSGNDRPGRLYFVKYTADERSTHHLNVTELGTECWFSHVAFRDYLRAHPEAREAYRKLKLALAQRYASDRPAYQEGKGAFIESVLALVRSQEDAGQAFRIGAFAIILDEESRVLLCHRRDHDLWNLPGGRVEAGETPWQGVLREAKEETGLDARVVRLAGVYGKPDVNEVVFSFVCAVVGGSTTPTEEADRMAFFAPDSLPPNTPPKQVERIRDAFAHPGEVVTKTQRGESSVDRLHRGKP
jgi:GrpB-like predicted nucleotidyltransferase (UPF0157 family)/ADP-ribose pyrophosphatase YjhB (NUDIX family)